MLRWGFSDGEGTRRFSRVETNPPLVKLVDVNYDDDAVLPLSLVFEDADWEYLEGVSRGQYADPTRQGDISRLSHLLDRLLTEVPRLIDPN